jgi:hypothetical protein
MYACFYTFFFLDLGYFGAYWRRSGTLPSRMGRVKIGLKDRFWALVDLAVIAKYEKTGKSTRKPAVVSDGQNGPLIGIEAHLGAEALHRIAQVRESGIALAGHQRAM